MKIYLADTPLGFFLLNDQGEIRHLEQYKDVDEAAENISKLTRGVLSGLLKKLLPELRGYDTIITDNPSISDLLQRGKVNSELSKPCKMLQAFRASLPSHALSAGLMKSSEEFNEFERALLYEIAKIGVKGVSARRDIYAAQMVRAVDDIDKSLNLFSGRIREWFGLHYPELDNLIESHEVYLKLVVQIGKRENWNSTKLTKAEIPEEKINQLTSAANKSMGAEISDDDLKILQSFGKMSLTLFKLRDEISLYVEKVMEEFAPNLLAIVGSLIAARLVSLAGGIENLAKMPASTIQVLGAEKALFRHLKTGTRPPKHGVIFQHAAIHQSPRWQRGKVARALAAKIAITARLDAYEGDFQGEQLKIDFEKRVEEIRKRFTSPPKKEVKKHRKRRKGKKS